MGCDFNSYNTTLCDCEEELTFQCNDATYLRDYQLNDNKCDCNQCEDEEDTQCGNLFRGLDIAYKDCTDSGMCDIRFPGDVYKNLLNCDNTQYKPDQLEYYFSDNWTELVRIWILKVKSVATMRVEFVQTRGVVLNII